MVQTAYNYQNGEGMPLDLNKAFYWMKRSVDVIPDCDTSYCLPNSARMNLGLYYRDGIGCNADGEKAAHYLEIAAYSEDEYNWDYFWTIRCKLDLGKLYFDGNLVQKDLDKAEKYFDELESDDCSTALFYLGQIYEEKYNDPEKALKYYQLAAAGYFDEDEEYESELCKKRIAALSK